MQLVLENVVQKVGAATWLYPMSLSLQSNVVTVLLGATQAGKTSLMRIMAGLDTPTEGRVWVDGQDVTGVPVRQRNVAMVYQQFINYPSMTVAQNIASPLKLRGDTDIAHKVQSLAQRLHIDPFLDRLPAELSGGQQQRVALARALAKDAPLMLLDEPLVNLDYKLREGLRDELTQLFEAGRSTVVYATTEPAEALMLGGYTAVLEQGELLQYGPTSEVFRSPKSLRVARAFSDPPMNLVPVQLQEGGTQMRLPNGVVLTLRQPVVTADATAVLGVRASALTLQAQPGSVEVRGQVHLAEISGSDTFVHVQLPWGDWVVQLTGVHKVPLNAPISVYLLPDACYVFDSERAPDQGGALLQLPTHAQGG
nr:ABC transporter ATP-binding protein [uncultured Comamonas sp.]